jgi:tRNA(fMet)-specific endonuclease VapC
MYDAIDLYAEEKSRLRLNGTPADDDFDLLIGCTSIVNNLTLVTDNTDDFKRIKDIKMENWIIR